MEILETLENSPTGWLILVPGLLWTVFSAVCWWRLYAKAGYPGWTSLIPVYNLAVCFRFLWGRGWWALLLLVPVVNVFVVIRSAFLMAECFGKGLGFGFGLFFLPGIFIPILALGSAQYRPHY